MAVFTKLEKKEIEDFLEDYSIGNLISFEGIVKGTENTNFKIITSKNKYILTILEKRVEEEDLPFFMNLMFGLSKYKIRCPEPVKNKKGKYLFKIKNKSACLVSFLQGKDKNNLNYRECFIVGKQVAQLHLASKKLNLYRKNDLSVNSWGPLLKKIDKRINNLSRNLKNLMKNDLADIKKKWPKKIPKGIIHSDLFIDNIFFNKGKFYGFIDFYFSANDFLAYELATCINALCFNKKNKHFFKN